MSIKTIITKGRKFDGKLKSAIQRTVVEQAKDIADDIWDTFSENLTTEQAKEIGDGIGGEVAARASEWKAFAEAVPYGMSEAITEYDKTKGEEKPTLTRVRLFRLARWIKGRDYTQVKSSVAAFIVEELKPKNAGSKASIASHVKGIFKVQTRKKDEIAFRKELAELCKKHGIKY